MDIKVGNRDLAAVYIGGLRIISIQYRGECLWPHSVQPIDVILSCFSSGRWYDEYPWDDNVSWVD